MELEWEEKDNIFTAKKEVKILNKNSSNAPAFIRVCLVPRYTATITKSETNIEVDVTNTAYINDIGEFPEEINNNSYNMGDIIFNLNSEWSINWIYSDGYFYCKKSIVTGDTTPVLLESVSIPSDKIYEGVTVEIDVLADSIQTEGQEYNGETNALSERWGNKIEVDTDGNLKPKEKSINE